MKKSLRLCLVLSMTVCVMFAACGKADEQEEDRREETTVTENTESVAEETTKDETQPEPEEQPEENFFAEKTYFLLHPLIYTTTKRYYNNERNLCLLETKNVKVELDETEKAAYPLLAAALEEKYAQDLDAQEDILFGEEDLTYAEEYAEQMGYTPGEAVFTNQDEITLHRCDEKVFSFVVGNYMFTGGAHGMYGYGGYSYDTATGRLLTADDIFTDKEKLAAAIYKELISEYTKDAFFYGDELLDTVKDYIAEGWLNMVLTNRGPRIYFNPYEIGPYAAGVFEVNLYPEVYPDLVKEEYAADSESWIMELPYAGVAVDVDGDGTPENVRREEDVVYYESGDSYYSELQGFNVYAGEEKIAVSAYGYSSEAYLVKSRGKYFVYVILPSENDYHSLYVVDVTDKKMSLSTKDYGVNAYVANKDVNYDGYADVVWTDERSAYTLTDPANMWLGARTDFMSTSDAIRLCHVGEDGVPVFNEGHAYYEIKGEYNFTALRDVAGKLLDEAGNEIEDYTIKSGETVRYFRTDAETFGDVKTSDGKIVRVYMKHEGWPYTIDGVPLEEVFDGIVFAG